MAAIPAQDPQRRLRLVRAATTVAESAADRERALSRRAQGVAALQYQRRERLRLAVSSAVAEAAVRDDVRDRA